MSYEKKTPVILLCCGSFNPFTIGHAKSFEIARNFLDGIGSYSVIGGIVSPVHDRYGKQGLIDMKHRITMCKLATQNQPWISVDTWECDQTEWTETIKVLRHHNAKIKSTYATPVSLSQQQNRKLSTQWAVTLQPSQQNAPCSHISVPLRSTATGQSGGQRIVPHPMAPYLSNKQRSTSLNLLDTGEDFEINEASEPNLHDKTGLVLNKLGENIQKMCCVQPMPFGYQPGMIYGANCDFRKTKVMLLCGSDLLESFLTPGLWKEEDIRELVSQFGIICIPRNMDNSTSSSLASFNPCGVGGVKSKNNSVHEALDYLHSLTRNMAGTVILVNDSNTNEISSISSTKCRQSLREDNAKIAEILHPAVLRYIQHHALYTTADQAA